MAEVVFFSNHVNQWRDRKQSWNWEGGFSLGTCIWKCFFFHFHLGELYFLSTSYPSAYAPHGSLYKIVDPARLVIKDGFSLPSSFIITRILQLSQQTECKVFPMHNLTSVYIQALVSADPLYVWCNFIRFSECTPHVSWLWTKFRSLGSGTVRIKMLPCLHV